MKRCTSLNDTQQIIADLNLLYIRQISKKLQVEIVERVVMFPSIYVVGLVHFNITTLLLRLFY